MWGIWRGTFCFFGRVILFLLLAGLDIPYYDSKHEVYKSIKGGNIILMTDAWVNIYKPGEENKKVPHTCNALHSGEDIRIIRKNISKQN